MKGRTLFTGIAMLCAVLTTGSLAAAQTAQPQWYVMHQEFAKPSMLKEYEATSQEFMAAVRQHREAMPMFNFTGFSGDDFVYTFVTRINSFSDLEGIYGGFGKLAKMVGEKKWGDLMMRAGQTMDSVRDSILMEDPSLSYMPARPRLKPEEERYVHVDLYYVQPGREADADDICRKFADLYRQKNVTDGYRVFKVVMGWDTPLIIVITAAKSPADYEALVAQARQMVGAEGKALFDQAFALTRRFEMHGGWVRPDLTLLPAGAQGK